MTSALASTTTTRLPRAFGRYILFDDVGRGGMAEIYLARASTDAGASRHVVVKQILPEYAGRADFAEMLVKEAKLAAKLSHKNVVQVLDLGRTSEDGELFIAMEYVEGYDLAALLKRCSKDKVPLPPEFALHVVMETLAGLDYAHRAKDESGAPLGIVHRDVSPSNVLISFEGEVKVCDFGIARANDSVGKDADGEALKGKAGYMSPEHARGEPLDARADVFAAGILLWELFSGRKLYSKAGGSLLEQARKAEIPELEQEGLREIAKKALAPAKEDRYRSAAAMLRDLEEHVRTAKLQPSAIKLGEWLTLHFGADIVEKRRARERAAQAIVKGPAVVLRAIKTPEPAPIEQEEPVPASLVATSMDIPAAHPSTPALVRESAPPETKNKLNPWIWVGVALAVLGALWFALHR